MNVTRAFYLRPPQRGLQIEIEGQPAVIKPEKQTLLKRGLVILSDAEDVAFPWVTLNLAYHLDGDPTNFDPSNAVPAATDDPVIVCMAHRYVQAVREGLPLRGRVQIPTRAEAVDELDRLSLGPKPGAPQSCESKFLGHLHS